MKKRTVWATVMAALSILAVMVASSPVSVRVFRTQSGTMGVYSFFQFIEDAPAAMCLLYAGICSGITLMISVAYLIRKKTGWLKGILGFAFASATLAVLPLLIRSEPMVLPNMAHPLAMTCVCVVAILLLRSQRFASDEPKGERLG